MKHGTSRHPKLHDLMRRLHTTRRDAIGLLELLWEYTAKYAPRGDIGRWSNADIAEAVDWKTNPDAMIAALVDARWLDASDEHRLIIHDWHEHAPEYIKKRLSRAGIGFVQTTADNGGQRLPTKAGQGKSSQVQPREGKPADDAKKPLPKKLLSPLFAAAFNNNGTAKQRAAFVPVVQAALALGATPGLLLSRLKPRPDDPWVAVRQAGKDVKAMIDEFRKLLGKDSDALADVIAGRLEFDPDASEGISKQGDLDALRAKYAKLLAELKEGC